MSPSYFSDAYQVLRDDPRISCAEVGTTFVDMGDSKFINASQPSMYGRTPLDRMRKWNGVTARVTMYNASRRSTLEAAIQFLRESPLPGMTMVEDLWELNRLALGEFVVAPGHGCLVHYPEYGSILGDRSNRFYNLLCRDIGLGYPALFFMGLSTAVQCAIFLMGNMSPISDPRQRRVCAQHVFEHVFRKSFLPSIASGINLPEMTRFFEKHPQVLNGLQKYCSPPFSLNPVLNQEVFDWFVDLIRLLESNPLQGEERLSERFQKFADAREWSEVAENGGEGAYENGKYAAIHASNLSSGSSSEIAALSEQNEATQEADQEPQQDFYSLWQCGHSYLKRDVLWIAERMEVFTQQPVFHLVVIAPDGGDDLLAHNIRSLGHQFYLHWKLSIISAAEVHPALRGNQQVAWIRGEPGHHLALANAAMLDTEADWVGMWEAGDKLAPHALFVFVDRAERHPEVSMFYSDEDRVNVDDTHSTPYFKTDFNLEMLRAAPFVVGGVVAVST